MKCFLLCLFVVSVNQAYAQKHALESKFNFEISKRTTFVTKPVTKSGFVDLIAAINQKQSKGVIPETNAAVPLTQSVGPQPDGMELEEIFFEELGISRPNSKAYFQNYEDYLRTQGIDQNELEAILEHQFDAMNDPWMKDEYPELFEWVSSQARFLDHVEAAVKRPHYYRPTVGLTGDASHGQGLFCIPMPDVHYARKIAIALINRSMLHLGKGDTKQAWQDVMTTIRLGRHIGNGATMAESLVGCSIESMGDVAVIKILQNSDFNEATFRQITEELNELPGRTRLADKMDFFERLVMVDIINILANGNDESNDVLLFVDGLPRFEEYCESTLDVAMQLQRSTPYGKQVV